MGKILLLLCCFNLGDVHSLPLKKVSSSLISSSSEKKKTEISSFKKTMEEFKKHIILRLQYHTSNWRVFGDTFLPVFLISTECR